MAVITTNNHHTLTLRQDNTAVVITRPPIGQRVPIPVAPSITIQNSGVVPRPNIAPQTLSPGGYAQAAVPIRSGQPVRLTVTGQLALAAGTVELCDCVGVAMQTKQVGEQCLYASDGIVNGDYWLLIAGAASLLPGHAYFLGAQPGTITPIPPSSGVLLRIGIATGGNMLDIGLGEAVVLST